MHRGFVVREGQAAPAPCVLAASGPLHQDRAAAGHFAGFIVMDYSGKHAHMALWRNFYPVPKIDHQDNEIYFYKHCWPNRLFVHDCSLRRETQIVVGVAVAVENYGLWCLLRHHMEHT